MMDAKFTGLDDLNRAFKQLGADVSNRIGRRMVASAAGVIKKEAKSIAQSRGLKKTGALINNIVTKRENNVPDGIIQYNVGVRHGMALGNGKKVVKYLAVGKQGRIVTKRKNDPFYWKFAEFGTRHQAATPFIGPALVNKQQAAIDAMGKTLDKELVKAGK